MWPSRAFFDRYVFAWVGMSFIYPLYKMFRTIFVTFANKSRQKQQK